MAISEESKMVSPDRVLTLKVMDSKLPQSATGIIDKNLFTGENKLHVKMDLQTCLWTISYERGVVPEIFKQRFTSFKMAKKFLEDYFKKRNVEITEVRD